MGITRAVRVREFQGRSREGVCGERHPLREVGGRLHNHPLPREPRDGEPELIALNLRRLQDRGLPAWCQHQLLRRVQVARVRGVADAGKDGIGSGQRGRRIRREAQRIVEHLVRPGAGNRPLNKLRLVSIVRIRIGIQKERDVRDGGGARTVLMVECQRNGFADRELIGAGHVQPEEVRPGAVVDRELGAVGGGVDGHPGAQIPNLVEPIADSTGARARRLQGAQAVAAADKAIDEPGVSAGGFGGCPPIRPLGACDHGEVVLGGRVQVNRAMVPQVGIAVGRAVRVAAAQVGQMPIVSARE